MEGGFSHLYKGSGKNQIGLECGSRRSVPRAERRLFGPGSWNVVKNSKNFRFTVDTRTEARLYTPHNEGGGAASAGTLALVNPYREPRKRHSKRAEAKIALARRQQIVV